MGTRAVWAGEDGPWSARSTQVPVVHSVGFGYSNLDEWMRVATGEESGHIYSRNTNPTVAVFEEKLRALEDGGAAVAFASGMAAISDTLHTLLVPGRRVVSTTDTYGGTSRVFRDFLPSIGIDVELVNTDDVSELEAQIKVGCDMVYLETPTNPTLKVLDIERIAKVSHDAGAIVVVDNTVATPVNQRPLNLGADLVIHSASKYLGGHADALGGGLVGKADLVNKVFRYREIDGAALDPMAAYLLLRGMKTLHLRVARQSSSAQTIAEFLASHPKVAVVNYPGLASHPQHEIARRQMVAFGGLLSFALDGGLEATGRLIENLLYAHAAANLGAVETTVGPPATTSHVELTAAERRSLGIPEGLVRYSTGIEDVADLVEALEAALAAI